MPTRFDDDAFTPANANETAAALAQLRQLGFVLPDKDNPDKSTSTTTEMS
jgi:hypothetical protein